jgi:hypothetical protein
MKVFRYLLIMVLFVARLSATITPTADVYGPQVPSSFTATLTTGLAFQQASDLLIVNAGQPGAVRSPATVLKLGSDYVVTGGGYNSANQMQVGSFTLTNTGPNSPITGDNLYVIRNVPANQLTVFANGGYLTAAMIEQALDKQATLAQMTVNNGMASLHVETYETANAVPPKLLMTKNARSGNLVGFDANGNVAFYPVGSSGGGGSGTITSVSGTTNQVIAVTTNNAVTLSTPQNIDTSAAVQFGSLGIGIAPTSNIPVNFQPTVTDNAGGGKAVRISPTINQTQTGDTIYDTILGGTINANSYTGGSISELTLGSPTVSGSFSIGYQLYLAGLNSGTFSTKYGIFQNGTETNQLNNLKLTPSGGGGITFADGSVQYTAATGGGGGGGIASVTGTTNQVIAITTNNAVVLSTPQNIDSTATPQFAGLGVGIPLVSGVGVNIQATVTTNGQQAKGLRVSPVLSTAENTDSLYVISVGGTVSNAGSYTGATFSEETLGSPTISGSYTTGYQLYLAGLNTGTFGTKYGIYQNGTEPNYFGGALTVPNFTATGTTTLATSLTGYLYGTSGVVSAVTTIPTSALSGTISLTSQVSGTLSVANGGTGVTTSTGTGSTVLSASPTFTGTLTAANLTATGTTTLATSLSGYLSASSGVVSASSTIPTTVLSGTITNAQLANSSIMIAGTSTALGGSISQDTITGLSTTGLVKRTAANTLAIATSGTDYAPATSGTSLLYGNGSGGFSNATVSSTNLTFSSGTLNTIQNIATTSSPQFSSLGIGAAASGTAGDLFVNNTLAVGSSTIAGTGVNLSPSVTASGGNVKSVRVSPTMTAAVNGDNLYDIITGGTIVGGSYTTLSWTGLGIGTPTISTGTLTNSYDLYLNAAPTATNHYGIYQLGTDPNYFAGAFQMTTTAKAATNQNLTPGTTTVTSGSSITIDWSKGNSFDLTLTSATAATMNFSNAVDGQVITIAIHQPASGTATTVSWSGVSTIKWSGGTAPTQTATLSKTDVYTIYYNATAGAYYGSYVQNF